MAQRVKNSWKPGEELGPVVQAGPVFTGLPVTADLQAKMGGGEQRFTITGTDSAVVTVNINPGDYVDCETGAMVFSSEDIKIQAKMRRCCGPAVIGGEGQFKTRLVNSGSTVGYAGVANPAPGVVVPVNLGRFGPQGVLFVRDSWFLSLPNPASKVYLSWSWPKNVSCAAKCCGGGGLIMQKITGNQGDFVFVTANGTILEHNLADGQSLIVEETAVLGFTPGVSVALDQVGGCLMCCVGGQGCFNTKLTGPGTVWLQSMSLAKLKAVVGAKVAEQQGGDGSASAGGKPEETEMTR